jgi:hypothetical protein
MSRLVFPPENTPMRRCSRRGTRTHETAEMVGLYRVPAAPPTLGDRAAPRQRREGAG